MHSNSKKVCLSDIILLSIPFISLIVFLVLIFFIFLYFKCFLRRYKNLLKSLELGTQHKCTLPPIKETVLPLETALSKTPKPISQEIQVLQIAAELENENKGINIPKIVKVEGMKQKENLVKTCVKLKSDNKLDKAPRRNRHHRPKFDRSIRASKDLIEQVRRQSDITNEIRLMVSHDKLKKSQRSMSIKDDKSEKEEKFAKENKSEKSEKFVKGEGENESNEESVKKFSLNYKST